MKDPAIAPVFVRTAEGGSPIPLTDYIQRVVESNPRAAQLWREMNRRALDLGCFEAPDGKEVLEADDTYGMLIDALVAEMLVEGEREEPKR